MIQVRAGQGQEVGIRLKRKGGQQRLAPRCPFEGASNAETGLEPKGRIMGRSFSLHLSDGEAVATQRAAVTEVQDQKTQEAAPLVS